MSDTFTDSTISRRIAAYASIQSALAQAEANARTETDGYAMDQVFMMLGAGAQDPSAETEAAFAGFFSAPGNNAAAAGLRPAVNFSKDYLPGRLGGTVSALNSAYRSQRKLAQGQPGGAERVDRLYEQGKELVVTSFTRAVGEFLEQYGQPGQLEKVLQSVQAVIASRKAGGSAPKGNAKDGLYTLEELDFAAVSVSAYRSCLQSAQRGNGSEVKALLVLNRVEQEAQSFCEQGALRPELAELLCSSGRNAYRELLYSLEGILARGNGVDTRG